MSGSADAIEIQRPPVIRFGSGPGREARRLGAGARLSAACSWWPTRSMPARVERAGAAGQPAVFGTVKPEPDIPNLEALLDAGRARRSRTSSSASAAAAPWTWPSWRRCCPAAASRFTTWSGRRRCRPPRRAGAGARPPPAPAARPAPAPWSPTRPRRTSSRCRAGTCWPTSRSSTPT